MWLNVGFDFVVCGFLLHYFFLSKSRNFYVACFAFY